MAEANVLRLHSADKQAVDIVAASEGTMFAELYTAVFAWLNGKFEASIRWYPTTVKLDL